MARPKANAETVSTGNSDELIIRNLIAGGKLNRVLKGLDFKELKSLKLTVDKVLKDKLEDEKNELAKLEASLNFK